MVIDSLKKHAWLALLLVAQCANAEEPISGLIGGTSFDAPPPGYAATVLPSGVVTPLSLGITNGEINSVDLNNSGLGFIGGKSNNSAYAAYVSTANGIQPILGLPPVGTIHSVSLNESNIGLLGGTGSFPVSAYAAFVNPDATLSTVYQLPSMSDILSTAINSSNLGLLGGFNQADAYVAFVSPNNATPFSILVGPGDIDSVALSNSGTGFVGGSLGVDPYAAFVSSGSPLASSITLPLAPTLQLGAILNVALNDNGTTGLLGGFVGDSAYAAFAFSGNSTPRAISGLPNGEIVAVAINEDSVGLIGGQNFTTNNAYAAFVSLNMPLQEITGLPQGIINTVAINKFNQGLIGGENFTTGAAYAALVSPSGVLTPLSVGLTNGSIASVALNSFSLSMIPMAGLQGNNVTFADYINANAPQDVFYFVPSIVDGSLEQAVESAAPTRNAVPFNVMMQNAFYMTTSLSTHIHEQRPIHRRHVSNPNRPTALLELEEEAEGELLASRSIQATKTVEKKCAPTPSCCVKTYSTHCKPTTIWIEGIGALSSQNAQHETPGFDPKSAGGIIGFDAMASDNSRFGFGGSYLYTKIDQDNNQGRSKIQQEDLFLYFSWEPRNFYVDLGAWGGLYQTRQTRNIHMTGFDFTSTSKPKGWQIVPHLEIGWLSTPFCFQKFEFTWNLFGMADWAHAWQKKTQEKGSGPFNVKQKSYYGSLLRAEGGLRFTETVFMNCWNLIFQEKGSYVNIQSFKDSGKVNAVLIGSPGSFTLETLTDSLSLGVVQLLVSAAPYRCCFPTSSLFWQGEFGSGYTSQQLGLEFAWNF